MAEDDELQLSDSACRVFVALALAGGHVSSASALQRMAGVSKRQTRARAVKELEREGLVVVDQVPGGAYTGFRLSPAVISDLIGWSESKTSVVSDVSKKTDLLTYLLREQGTRDPSETPQTRMAPVMVTNGGDTNEAGAWSPQRTMGVPSEDHGGALKGPWGSSQGTTGVPSEDHDLWARCEAVDAMEDTAASSAPGTPYIANAKLRTQVGLVQEVWAHFLPSEDPLKDYDARSLLRGAKGSTQVAHDAVAITADVIKEGRVRTTPVAFAKGTAARIANGDDMPRPVRSATASSTATGTGDGRSTDELAEPNEEQRRRLDRVKNLGALFGED